MSIEIIAVGIVGIIVFGVFARVYLRGESLARYDQAPGSHTVVPMREPSEGYFEALESLKVIQGKRSNPSPGGRLATLRAAMEGLGDGVNVDGLAIRQVDAGGVPGEWVVADDADPDRRLLFIHGGAFVMGSPRSHRRITTKLSRISGSAVLAIDYRLMPEHGRLDGLADCESAYRWVLENGPNGPCPVATLFVAGDSAGGNLSLALVALARDAGLRPADAVVALSPVTDGTMTGPSVSSNVGTDHMLRPLFGRLARLPLDLVLLLFFLKTRIRPCDPRVSPVHGDLSRLPPTLIHASEAEMLLDDARRYVNKATRAGSDATLETWPHMLHVWHIFEPILPEAKEAFEHIARFLEICAPRTRRKK